MTKSRFPRSLDSGSSAHSHAAVRPSPGNGLETTKDQLDNAISASRAMGRDNGVTALRHDTPISVSQAEDEVMAGRIASRARRRSYSRGRMTEKRRGESASRAYETEDGGNEEKWIQSVRFSAVNEANERARACGLP
ncbi:hypothetical protein HN011_008227 [Eciton burchellii]|nr:hypothetical protein HN011_008227 [Eciton burchellii]